MNYNCDAKLLILGEGHLRTELKLLINELDLSKNVFLIGRRLNPFPYLKRADCFVLSSKHEGQGLVLLEAMILGIPIVSTDFPCVHDILGAEHGLIVENSVDGLIDGMKAFLDGKVQSKPFDYESYQKNALTMFYAKVLGEPGCQTVGWK
jgi:CDP-glycerol glycerophosphotransferase